MDEAQNAERLAETDVFADETQEESRGFAAHTSARDSSPYIFISYSHMDDCFVQQLVEKMQQRNINYWLDVLLHGGARWDDELMDRIERSHVFIALLSNQYYESKNCSTEIEVAMNENRLLLPVVCEKVTTSYHRFIQRKVDTNYQKTQFSAVDSVFDQISVIECLLDENLRLKRRNAALEQLRKEGKLEEYQSRQKLASELSDAMSTRTIEREVRSMFELSGIPAEPAGMIKPSRFARPRRGFTDAEIETIRAKSLELLHTQQNQIKSVLFEMAFESSRMAYKAALTAVKQIEYLTQHYDFWTYKQNQKLHYFITDSAPLLRLMRGRALREQRVLSERMISAVKHFAVEFDGVIDCLEDGRDI